MSESNLKLYSLGVVVEAKPEGVDFILVTPIEDLNIQTPGKIKDYSKSYKGDKKEVEATNFKTEHEAKNYIRARWLPFGMSNRVTAPDVNANETVILFKFGDVDDIYWTTIFREPELRRLEEVAYSYSNLPKGMVAFDKDSSYWVKISTLNKIIQLHTSMNDGEHTTYDITFNTKAGTLEVKDGKNNSLLLDSPNNTLKITTDNAVNVDAKSEVNIKTKVANVIADTSLTLESPNIALKGITTIEGDLFIKGDVKGDGVIMDKGGNSNHHSH